MGKTKIHWSQYSWNPIKSRLREDTLVPTREDPFRIVPAGKVGYYCERVSGGCKNCYACAMNGRTLPAWGTGLDYAIANRDKQEIFIDEAVLAQPLKWKASRKIFPCSMTDWAADFVADEMMDRLLAVAAVSPRHTFQFLTKRADRLAAHILSSEERMNRYLGEHSPGWSSGRNETWWEDRHNQAIRGASVSRQPLPNVQLGFSAEDQPNFDARWHEMRKLAAAGWFVWVSLEPLLGPINVRGALMEGLDPGQCANCGSGHGFTRCPNYGSIARQTSRGGRQACASFKRKQFALAWGVTGGESGAGARPSDLAWYRSLIDQFAAAATPLFVKQAGAYPVEGLREDLIGVHPTVEGAPSSARAWESGAYGERLKLKDKKGGDPSEWPEWMRVRQFPEVR